ncbi:MAG: hypothetical protein JWR75_559 [Devosia sp.]|nr:hypothetical protein [Devosia sp.]
MEPFEPGQGHYPYQAPIDAYGGGGFRFAGMSHKGSLLALPTGMFAWDVTAAPELTRQSLTRVFDVAARLDVLLIGLGTDIGFLDPLLRQAFRDRGVVVEAIATGAAVRTYNILLGEQRAVGAALIAVDANR